MAFADAPQRQRHAEIGGVAGKAEIACHVEQAADAGGAVDEEAHHGVAGAAWLGLQHVVGELGRACGIQQEIVDGAADRARDDGAVSDRDGAEEVGVEAVVDLVEEAVGRLELVVGGAVVCHCLGVGRGRGCCASNEAQCQAAHGDDPAKPGDRAIHSRSWLVIGPRNSRWETRATTVAFPAAAMILPAARPVLHVHNVVPTSFDAHATLYDIMDNRP